MDMMLNAQTYMLCNAKAIRRLYELLIRIQTILITTGS